MTAARLGTGSAGEVAAAAGAARPRRAEIVSDYGTFLALEPAWNALAESSGINHPFLSHAWMRAWWECFGSGKALQIVVVRAGPEVLAIAPLMIGPARLYGLPVRRLGSISNDHTPRFDFIVTGRPEEVYREIWMQLMTSRERWDIVELCQLPEGSRTLSELPTLAARDRFLPGTWRSDDSPYVPLGDGWDRYIMSLSHNHRAKLRKRLRRLARIGSVELETVATERGVGIALEEGLRMEAAGWKTGAGTAILCHPPLRRFYLDLARATARAGSLRLIFLKVGARRIAFSYALCEANRLYVLKAGYDPGYAEYSPYNLLCYLVLQDACRQGLVEYDFLGASEDWKLHWTRERRAHFWLYVMPPSLGGRLLHWTKFRAARSLRALHAAARPGG